MTELMIVISALTLPLCEGRSSFPTVENNILMQAVKELILGPLGDKPVALMMDEKAENMMHTVDLLKGSEVPLTVIRPQGNQSYQEMDGFHFKFGLLIIKIGIQEVFFIYTITN